MIFITSLFLNFHFFKIKGTLAGNKNENNNLNIDTKNDVNIELSDIELRKIVAEKPLDDPLNAFYDPFEPYRLSTFAYWHPITFPKDHANPPIPAGFLPPTAPPKSFPDDFFFHDEEFRRIVLGEHAAAFCPFMRKWREKHPLKAYPGYSSDFIERHPPIKFTHLKGYEIDWELERLNVLTRQAQNKILQEAEAQDSNKIKETDKNVSSKLENKINLKKSFVENSNSKKQKTKPVYGKVKKQKKTRAQWEFEILLEAIETVRKGETRPDCKSFSKFTSPSESAPNSNFNFIHTPPTCLQEAIFHMEELEDLYDPIELEDNIPEPVNKDKVEHYRQILVQYDSAINSKSSGGKCPFSASQKSADNNNNKEHENETTNKVYQGTVPKWAQLVTGENLFSSEHEEDAQESETRAKQPKRPEKYRFAYKSVPFPSIQKTLKKYVSL